MGLPLSCGNRMEKIASRAETHCILHAANETFPGCRLCAKVLLVVLLFLALHSGSIVANEVNPRLDYCTSLVLHKVRWSHFTGMGDTQCGELRNLEVGCVCVWHDDIITSQLKFQVAELPHIFMWKACLRRKKGKGEGKGKCRHVLQWSAFLGFVRSAVKEKLPAQHITLCLATASSQHYALSVLALAACQGDVCGCWGSLSGMVWRTPDLNESLDQADRWRIHTLPSLHWLWPDNPVLIGVIPFLQCPLPVSNCRAGLWGGGCVGDSMPVLVAVAAAGDLPRVHQVKHLLSTPLQLSPRVDHPSPLAVPLVKWAPHILQAASDVYGFIVVVLNC